MGYDATTQSTWVGFETVPGTPAEFNQLLTMGTLTLEAEDESKSVQRQGALYPFTNINTRKRSTFALADGFPCYYHLPVVLASVAGNPFVTALGPTIEGPPAYEYEFPFATSGDGVTTWTIGHGDFEHVRVLNYGLVTSISLSWNVESGDVDFAFSGVGGPLDQAGEQPVSMTQFKSSPITAQQVEVYVADTLTAVRQEAAKVDNAYAVNIEIGDRFKGHGAFGEGAGYSKAIARKPSGNVVIQQLNDANSRSWVDRYYENRKGYIRIVATGRELIAETAPEAGDAVYEQFIFECALTPENSPVFENDDDANVLTTSGMIVEGINGFNPSFKMTSTFQALSHW